MAQKSSSAYGGTVLFPVKVCPMLADKECSAMVQKSSSDNGSSVLLPEKGEFSVS
jgi:hypothetical protein